MCDIKQLQQTNSSQSLTIQSQKQEQKLGAQLQNKMWDDLQQEQMDPHQLYLEQTANMQDTAKLGKTSFKANTVEKQTRNKKIKEAKKLTEKATAYTVEIHSALKELQEQPAGQPEAAILLQRLEQYPFRPQMFLTSEIRANFKEYISLVRDYDQLKQLDQSGAYAERINALEPLMREFRIRLQAFCEQNRVSLEGRILGEKEAVLKLTSFDIENWYQQVQQYTEHRESITRDPDEQPADLETVEKQYHEVKEQRELAQADDETEDELIEELEEQEQLLKAQTMVKQREQKIGDDGETPEILEELEETREDLQRLERRQMREEAGMVQTQPTAGAEVLKRTREDAITTHSDMLSIQSRELLGGMSRELRAAGLGAVSDIVDSYVRGTRYQVGYTEERNRLKKAMKAVANAKGQMGLAENARLILEQMENYFAHMTNGTLPEINQENAPEGQYFDYAGREVEESGKTAGGVKRNTILRAISYWQDQKNTPLFSHEPTVNDLKQRTVSNCYMVASVAGLVALEPSLLKECIRDNGDGTVTVRLFEQMEVPAEKTEQKPQEEEDHDDFGEDFEVEEIVRYELKPVYVRVSKEIPRIAGADALSAGALWMQMIEKACAYRGRNGAKGYRSLWYGEGGGFLTRLLGVEPEHAENQSDDELFANICNAASERFVYNAGSRNDAGDSEGLNSGHAYTVLGGKEENGQRYVLLRNPYSTHSLRYKENNKKKTTGSLLDISSDETYGQFYMKFEDFRKNFASITRTDLKKVKRDAAPV